MPHVGHIADAKMTKRRKAENVTTAREMATPAKIVEGHWQRSKGDLRGRWEQEKAKAQVQQYANEGLVQEYQLQAGLWYWEGAEILKRSQTGKDSIVRLVEEVRAGTSRAPMSAYAEKRLKEMISVESYLSKEDRAIVREICGKDRKAAEVMRELYPEEQSPHFPIPRLRIALTKLDKAITKARAAGFPLLLREVQ